jgi:hypothetical protein
MLTILVCGIVLRICGFPVPGSRRLVTVGGPRRLALRVILMPAGGRND